MLWSNHFTSLIWSESRMLLLWEVAEHACATAILHEFFSVIQSSANMVKLRGGYEWLIISIFFYKIGAHPWVKPPLNLGHDGFIITQLYVDIIIYPCINFIQGPVSLTIFLPAIPIRWKLRLAVIPLLAIRSQQIFAHATTAQLSCHVQNFVTITVSESRWEWNEISNELEMRWKKR